MVQHKTERHMQKTEMEHKFTWKILCTQVTIGSLWLPLAIPFRAPFGSFSKGACFPEFDLAALASFSKMSTNSFNKKFKNSCASCKNQADNHVCFLAVLPYWARCCYWWNRTTWKTRVLLLHMPFQLVQSYKSPILCPHNSQPLTKC